MKRDKQIGIQFFSAKGLEAKPFPKVTTKSPDFEIYLDTKLFSYCEVKSIIKYDWSGERNPPIWNNIQNKIHEARKQFCAVNTGHSLPNILVLLNHDSHYNFQDLYKVLKGKEPIPNIPVYDIKYLKRLSNAEDLMEVDLIIWLNSFRLEEKPFQMILAESDFKVQLKRYMR